MPLGNLKKYLHEVQSFSVTTVSQVEYTPGLQPNDSNTCRSNKHL